MTNQDKSNLVSDAWVLLNMFKDLQNTMQKMFADEFAQIEEFENQYALNEKLPF
jgi:hypothetical protein